MDRNSHIPEMLTLGGLGPTLWLAFFALLLWARPGMEVCRAEAQFWCADKRQANTHK